MWGDVSACPWPGFSILGESNIQLTINLGLRTCVSRCPSPRASFPIDERRDVTWALPVLKHTWDPMLDAAPASGGAQTIPSPPPPELNTHK